MAKRSQESDVHHTKGDETSRRYEHEEPTESKLWAKVKKDPVVPIGMLGFGVIVTGAIIGFTRRDKTKPTSTYWIRTRMAAQGFVVTLLTAAALYHAFNDKKEDHHKKH